ncbi:MAG: head-tail connector protein [Marivita sp.]|uniref:head-tail connector protein n=1 Tax=Marivita sp. TaxID=2003365 RepID=UPI0025C2A86F|nr:head-tail connector protein [Marivita sp.]MCI5111873.1 head-tail connector protein [Marivita sp.]
MYLIEESQIPEAALPVARLRDHLRMGSGFVEDGLQDGLLGGFLRAAMAAVEARTGKALLVRDFLCSLHRWRDVTGQAIPIAPVRAVTQVTLVDVFGAGAVVDVSRYALLPDGEAPRLVPVGACLPSIPEHGSAEIRFRAGIAEAFGDLPADLAQAVMLLAAHYYEYRDETALGQGCMPFGVTSLIARYRPVRLGFGA